MNDWAALGAGVVAEEAALPIAEGPAGDEGGHPEDDVGDAVDVSELLDDLKAMRARWSHEEHCAPTDFKLKVRGGKAGAERLGVGADSLRGAPCNQPAERFVQLAGLPRSATFHIGRYGELHAGELVRVWCHRLQYWFDLWLEKGGNDPPWLYRRGLRWVCRSAVGGRVGGGWQSFSG